MGARKPVGLDARQKPEEGRRVRDVRGLRLAGTASKEATETSAAVNDDRARIAGGGEDTWLVVVGEDSPLHRRLVSAVVEVLTDEGEGASGAAYGDASGVAVLYDEEARFTVVVEHIRVAHLVFLYEIPKLKEAVIRILKRRGGVGTGEHL